MKTSEKALLITAAVLIVAVIVLVVILENRQRRINELEYVEKQNIEMKRLNDTLVRAQSSYATKKDLETLIKDSGIDYSDLKKDLRTLRADVQALSTVTVVTPGYYGTNIPTNTSTPGPGLDPTVVNCPDGNQVECPGTDPNEHYANRRELNLSEPFANGKEVPIGAVGFSAWKNQNEAWDLRVEPRQYQATTVLSVDKNGRHIAHSEFSITVNGDEHKVPIDDAKIVEKVPEKKFRFSPRLYMGVDIGATVPDVMAEVTPNLQMSLFSYGHTKVNPQFTFVGVGVGYETQRKQGGVLLSPINYNIAKHLPFVDNIHVGPALSADFDGNVGVLAGVRAGL